MTPRVATEHWIKQDFTPAELAEYERELERKRELRHAMATTLGERVVGSAEFKQLKANLRPSDSTALTLSGKDVHLASLDAGETKTLIRSGSSTSAGAFLTSESDISAPVPARPLRVLDLVRSGEMSSDSVTFARQDPYTPVSASTAEASSLTTGTKPEATLAFTIATATAQTYASFVPVTRRSLSDSTELRALVDTRLTQDARQALETALLADVNTNAGQTVARASDTHSLAALKGITALRTADSEPSAIVVTPLNFESIASSATPAGGLSVDGGVLRLWGVPLVASASVPSTVALIADWPSAAAVWYRSADVLITDSNSDWFLQEYLRAFGGDTSRYRNHLGSVHRQSDGDVSDVSRNRRTVTQSL